MTLGTRTHYEVLGVPQTASDDDIKRAYRRLVRTAHPDTGGSDEAFRSVQTAYDVLRDPDKRRSYNYSMGNSTSSKPSAGRTTFTDEQTREYYRAAGIFEDDLDETFAHDEMLFEERDSLIDGLASASDIIKTCYEVLADYSSTDEQRKKAMKAVADLAPVLKSIHDRIAKIDAELYL